MAHTTAQQEQIDQLKKAFKLSPVIGTFIAVVTIGILAVILAGAGALVGCSVGFGLSLSFASLSPLIEGGIIGSALPALLFIVGVLFSDCVVNKSIDFINKQTPFEEDKKALKEDLQSMKEHNNSTEYKVKLYIGGILSIGVAFGIGAGLVALGFTSPAAIGALTALASPVVCVPLGLLINKIVECFFSKESEQPDGSLIGEVHVDEGSRILYP